MEILVTYLVSVAIYGIAASRLASQKLAMSGFLRQSIPYSTRDEQSKWNAAYQEGGYQNQQKIYQETIAENQKDWKQHREQHREYNDERSKDYLGSWQRRMLDETSHAAVSMSRQRATQFLKQIPVKGSPQ